MPDVGWVLLLLMLGLIGLVVLIINYPQLFFPQRYMTRTTRGGRATANSAPVTASGKPQHHSEHLPTASVSTSDIPPFLPALVHALHVLIIGQTRAGKTTITHTVALARARRGDRVLVCDPDAALGMWPGCTVSGYGDDFAAIEATLVALKNEMSTRRWAKVRRRSGYREQLAPLTLVLSEAGEIMQQCASARPVFEAVLRRGGKLGIGLLVDVQDKQKDTLKIPGATHLLNNFEEEIEVRKEGKRRVVAWRGADYDVPPLPDPETLADAYAARNALPTEDADRLLSSFLSAETDVPVHAHAQASEEQLVETEDTGTQRRGGTPYQDAVADDTDEGEQNGGVPATLTDEAIQTLFSAGWSRNRIAALLKGTKSKRLAQIEQALAAHQQE